MVEIFDSIVHPTVDGTWLNPRFNENCNFEDLLVDMKKYGIKKAFAVGMEGVGNYSHEAFMALIKPCHELMPVAFCRPTYEEKDLDRLKQLGYVGIKIHPRLSNISCDDFRIGTIVKAANERGICVLVCGYLGATEKFVSNIIDEHVLFLHSGATNIYNTFQSLKINKNVLFDLSYTFMNRELTEVILSLVQKYPERFCIGSDHPEVTLSAFRERFDEMTAGLHEDTVRMLAHRNIETFINRVIARR